MKQISPKPNQGKVKRKWFYVMTPDRFECAPCPHCGKVAQEWSEWEKHLWCAGCEVDYIPEHYGILDGPIQLEVCAMVGITFETFNLESGLIERPVLLNDRIVDWPVTGSLICQ